ncbi:hypothetical protein [Saccharibacillus kuerlensis]|uniref:Uncharacterized protein n=1 Tax=Saccharibacillus kuerlensis TaxID=459527 RepID=A0ABQ2KRT8_9BACL|nr:hypothetical protein [Saccharibacillus kuerlensis]GGN91394.1 hypothetical protein GCM10010969_03010 [Saccharibacillus kuerlensis]
MIKKHTIYKRDSWNMMTVEVHGRQLVLREISDQWGEDSHTFISRPEMMEWAKSRFNKEKFDGTDEEWQSIMDALKKV